MIIVSCKYLYERGTRTRTRTYCTRKVLQCNTLCSTVVRVHLRHNAIEDGAEPDQACRFRHEAQQVIPR